MKVAVADVARHRSSQEKNDRIDASRLADCLQCDFLPECSRATGSKRLRCGPRGNSATLRAYRRSGSARYLKAKLGQRLGLAIGGGDSPLTQKRKHYRLVPGWLAVYGFRGTAASEGA